MPVFCLLLAHASAFSAEEQGKKGKTGAKQKTEEKSNASTPGKAKRSAGDDPFSAGPDQGEWNGEVGILVEHIVVPHGSMTELMLKHAGKADSSGLREDVQKLVSKGEANVLETLYVRTWSGQRAKCESIHEVIYASEYNPADMPQTLTLSDVDAGDFEGAPTTPTAFETRNVGSTLEVDPIVGPGGEIIEVNLVPEIVEHVEDEYFQKPGTDPNENKDVRMPVFYTMKTTTAVSLRNGSYALIGVHTPRKAKDERVLVFLRADTLR